jgi:hypothetical protein
MEVRDRNRSGRGGATRDRIASERTLMIRRGRLLLAMALERPAGRGGKGVAPRASCGDGGGGRRGQRERSNESSIGREDEMRAGRGEATNGNGRCCSVLPLYINQRYSLQDILCALIQAHLFL